MLHAGIKTRAFPGAAAAITHQGKLVALKGLGAFTYDAGARRVQPDTIYDLASVSKVVATTAMAMLLHERGFFELDQSVAGVLPEFAAGKQVTFRHLLAHASGLPAYERLFERARTRDELLRAAFATPLAHAPGTHAEYSDIGFIILGVALERLTLEQKDGEPLDSFCAREVFGALAMARTGFRPPARLRPEIPPTVDDKEFRKKIIQGEVHDENAWVIEQKPLGGAAGHAGVFAPAEDVAKFAHCLLSGGAPILRRETVELFTRRESAPAGTARALGWDTPSQPSQSGKYFSPRSFGHLGYTGTSLWCDPERQLSVTLLTNRTFPGDQPEAVRQRIKQVRPAFHDAVVECVG